MHPGDLARGCFDFEMTWLLCCAGAATDFNNCGKYLIFSYLQSKCVVTYRKCANYGFGSSRRWLKSEETNSPRISSKTYSILPTSRRVCFLLIPLCDCCEYLQYQCFDTVGLVIWPVKIVPDMTYNVFGGTLNLAQSINQYHSYRYHHQHHH